MSLSSVSIKRPVAMCCFIITLVLLGLNSYRKIGIDLLPKFDIPFVQITTPYPGATPEEIEVEVGKKIEDAVASIDGLKHITTVCMENVCSTTLEFQLGVNVDLAIHDVREKLNTITEELPSGVETSTLSKININAISVVSMVLTGDRRLDDLYDYADDELSDRFSSIKGVGEVRLHGGNEMQLHIILDQEKLAAANLTVKEIVDKLNDNNTKMPAGRIRTGTQEISITYDAEFRNFDALRELEIGKQSGRRVYLRDVADIKLISKEIRQVGYYNDQPGVAIDIVKKSDANAVKVIDDIYKRYNEIVNSGTLPTGMKLIWFKDSGEFVKASVADAWSSIGLGILLTATLLFLFLHEPRSTFIVAITMPVSIIITFAAMQMMKYTFDMMTLISLGCSTGVLVTNSIVVIENIFKKLDEGCDRQTAAAKGTSEVLNAVAASALTNVVVFVPVAMMSSMVGLIMAPFAGVMVIATLVSLFVSFTLTPILASILFTEKAQTPAPWNRALFRYWDIGYNWVNEKFNKSVEWTAKAPGTMIAIILGFCIFCIIFVLPQVGGSFFPDNDRSEFTIKLEFPTDYSLETTKKRTLDIVEKLRKMPFVDRTRTTIGYVNAMMGTVNEGVYLSEIAVMTKPKGERESLWKMMDHVRDELAKIHNCKYMLSIPKPTGGSDTSVKSYIVGSKFDELERLNNEGINAIEKSGMCKDIDTSIRAGKPQVNLIPRRPILQNLNLNAKSLGTSIRGFFDGIEAGTYKTGGRSFDIRIKMEEKQGLDHLSNLASGSIKGNPLNLDVLVEKEPENMSISVIRHDKRRAAWFYANEANGVALSKIIDFLNSKITPLLPPGYRLGHSGVAEIMGEGKADFLEVFAIAIVLTFLLIAAIMESWSRPFLIMFTIPLGFIGLYISLWLAGMSLSMVGMLGGVMMIGIVVNNAILIMDECAMLINNGMTSHRAMFEAVEHKFRPIIMTSIASVAGMLPMAFGQGIGSEMRASCGVGVVGGLTLSAILTLYLIPALYFKFVHDTALPYRGFKWKMLNLIGIKNNEDKVLQYEMIAEEEEKSHKDQ